MSESRPYVSIDPGVQCGVPCIGGTRLPAEQFARIWWESGYTLERMLSSWPTLTREGLIVACWYMGAYDKRMWYERWRDWAKQWKQDMWEGNYDKVPLPPQQVVK